MKKQLTMKRAKRLLKIDSTKLDRYVLYYSNEIEYQQLSGSEKIKLEQYSKIWSLLRQGRPEDLVRTVIKREYNIEDRQARYLVEESKLLYGSVEDVDKEGRRKASIAYYDIMSHKAFEAGDYEVAAKLRKEADTLAGLFEKEVQGFDPSDFMKSAKFVFMNDTKILMQNMATDE